MRALARLGGLKSAETRRLKRVVRILALYARERGIDLDAALASPEPVRLVHATADREPETVLAGIERAFAWTGAFFPGVTGGRESYLGCAADSW